MIRTLFERRVPQILGLYVGATWMMIEIGDWVTERFNLAPNLTSYIFVVMVSLIPAVAVIAWFHGRPGKDEWTRVEKTVVPLNLVVAAAAAVYFIGPLQNVQATEIREVVDETGQTQTFEVPRAGFHRKITVFFLDNKTGDPELDWLSYGLSLMIAHDLNHETPLVTAVTPFDRSSLKEALASRGHADARGAPRALMRELAASRLSDVFVGGTVTRESDKVVAEIAVIDPESGAELARSQESGGDWLALADRLSQAIQVALELEKPGLGENDPLTDNLSGSLEAVRDYVNARRAIELQNDYPAAIGQLGRAVERDPSFAEAYRLMGQAQWLSGASQEADQSLEQASVHDYRLSQASRFELRAMRYQFEGDNTAAKRVLQMWTEVEPENPEAFRLLGRQLLVEGTSHDEAIAAFGRILELNPNAHEVYMNQAAVEQSRSNFDGASALVRKFLEFRPGDEDAHLSLARLSLAAGKLDDARDTFRDAAIMGADPVMTELGIASIDTRRGDMDAARARLASLLDQSLTPQQRVEVLNGFFETHYVSGRLGDALNTLETIDGVAQEILPPVVRLIQVGTTRASMKVLLGDFDAAREEVNAMREQMQPPFDRYLAFAGMGIEGEAGNDEAFLAALKEAEAFYRDSGNETLLPFVLQGQAYAAYLRDDWKAAQVLVKDSMAAFDNSFIKALSASAVNLETKVELCKLMVRLDMLDEAEPHLDGLIRQAPALATARLVMASLLRKRGEAGAARQQLDAALTTWKDADPRYLRLREARELLAELP